MSRSENQQLADLGVEARQVLTNPAFNEALRLMREDAYRQWKTCPIRDAEGQLLLLQAARLTDKVESVLRGILEAGKLASAKISIDEERDESAPRRLMRRVL